MSKIRLFSTIKFLSIIFLCTNVKLNKEIIILHVNRLVTEIVCPCTYVMKTPSVNRISTFSSAEQNDLKHILTST